MGVGFGERPSPTRSYRPGAPCLALLLPCVSACQVFSGRRSGELSGGRDGTNRHPTNWRDAACLISPGERCGGCGSSTHCDELDDDSNGAGAIAFFQLRAYACNGNGCISGKYSDIYYYNS
jgi:hypothetical protein